MDNDAAIAMFREFLQIPSVSTTGVKTGSYAKAAAWLIDALQKALGPEVNVEQVRTDFVCRRTDALLQNKCQTPNYQTTTLYHNSTTKVPTTHRTPNYQTTTKVLSTPQTESPFSILFPHLSSHNFGV